ncbi:hypothetical protein ACVDFE_00005, partial [Lentzea chajnantorensis]
MLNGKIFYGDNGRRAELGGMPGAENWALVFEINPPQGTAQLLSMGRRRGSRSNVRPPSKRFLTWAARQVGRLDVGGVDMGIEMAALLMVPPFGRGNAEAKARTVATIYRLALQQGLWPRPTLAD